MKKICCLLALTILAGRPALADETSATARPPEKQNTVLGQTEKNAAPDAADKKARDAQALFEESLRQMMPLDQGQIQEYRERSDQRDRTLLPVPPALRTRTVRVTLEPDSVRAPERKADALVLFQLAHHGPRASVPILRDLKETTDFAMLAFLDRVPPKDARRVRVEPGSDDVLVGEYSDKRYIRTTHTLMWPAWTASVENQAWIAAGKVGEMAGKIFEKDFDRPPTVRLESGTPVGVLVLNVKGR